MKGQRSYDSLRNNNKKDDLTYRSLALRLDDNGMPKTLDEKSRSVEVVGATENPVTIFDPERWEILDEVLLMSGCELPESRQVVLLDSHKRYGTGSVVGSYREMHIEKDLQVGRAFFTSLPEGDGPFTKLREGHLTDFSIGYRVFESEWIPAGKSATIQGRKFNGPLKVSTRWRPRELSICPIGADELAKARMEKPNQNKEEAKTMNEELKKRLIARGMDPNATDEEAWEFLDKLTDPGEGTRNEVTDEKANKQETNKDDDTAKAGEISREAIADERNRVSEIDAMCRRFDMDDDVRRDLIAKGTTISDARAKIMDIIEKTRQERPEVSPGFLGTIEIGRDERDKFRAAALDSVLIRGGMTIEQPAAGANDLRGYSLKELARLALRMANQPQNGTPIEMVGRALTTSDFPYILADSANKSLFDGYDTAPETWRTWCGIGQVSDFKTHSLVRASEFDDLDEVPEHGEFKYGERSEAREQYQVATYGKLYAITRQAIINDDLGALIDVPRGHGEAAARKVGDLPYAVLTANAEMGDGTALFASGHGNLGTGGVISETTIGEAIKLAKLQKDIAGKRRLNIRLAFFIGPVTIEGAAEIFFTSNQFAGSAADTTRTNPYAGTRFTRIYEARLDDDSTTAYYLAGPRGKTVTVFFLNGVQTPYLETKTGWTVDGVEYKVRIDAGAKAVDWKAMVKNAGA